MSKRVVLLTNRSRSAEGLAQALSRSSLDLVLIVSELEPKPPPAKGLGWLLRGVLGNDVVNEMNVWRGPRKVKEVLNVERILRNSADLVLEEQLVDMGISPGWPKAIPKLLSGSINDPNTIDRVSAERPDVLVVFGTGVLRSGILGTASMGALNAHSSLLPYYRGSRSEFWQCYMNDRDHVGITIHRIDPGVDTGEMLFQQRTETSWPTDPYSLRTLNTLAVLKNFPGVIEGYLSGTLTPTVQGPCDMPTFRNRDITLEKRLALFGRFSL